MASIYEWTSIEGQCPGQFQDIGQGIESFVGIEKQSSDVFCDIWLGIQSCIKG